MVSIKAHVCFFFKKTSPSTFVSTEDKTLDVYKNLLVRHDLAQLSDFASKGSWRQPPAGWETYKGMKKIYLERLSKHNTGANKERGWLFFMSDFLINVFPNQMLSGLLCAVTNFNCVKKHRGLKINTGICHEENFVMSLFRPHWEVRELLHYYFGLIVNGIGHLKGLKK